MASISQLPEETKQLNASSKRSEGARQRYNSRGKQRDPKINSCELHELMMASELVPQGRNLASAPDKKLSGDFDAASTAVPSSAEQSPELNVMESDLKAWPSLPTAEDGWNIYTTISDIDDDIWADLPEPAVPIEGLQTSDDKAQSDIPRLEDKSWWLVPGFGLTENEPNSVSNQEVPSKLSFADIVRDDKGQLPPASGTPMPAMRMQASQRRRNGATVVEKDQAVSDEESELQPVQWHGWTHDHKASWSKKQRRKVAAGKLQRHAQSCQTRGSLDDDDEV